MYLARLKLKNWRSYEDELFSFQKPTKRKPLYLIGAMNGHGKTSILVALYLGLFGKHGLRHCDGFGSLGDAPESYKSAICSFRRRGAHLAEPTEVDLTFAPLLGEALQSAIRIVRRWHFNSRQQLVGKEEVEVYRDGILLNVEHDEDEAYDKLQQLLFEHHVAPAFFFDGEQAQRLIEISGGAGLKKSVEVMFGTKTLDELREQIKSFINTTTHRIGGRRRAGEDDRLLKEKEQERERTLRRIEELKENIERFNHEKEDLEIKRRRVQEELSRMGGDRGGDIEKIQKEKATAERDCKVAEDELKQMTQRLGLALALSRLRTPIENRLKAEEKRERWENIKQGTLDRAEQVLAVAIPEPPSQDPLLGHLAIDIRERVKQRFKDALSHIYNPPPEDCPRNYLLGHIRGEMRTDVIEQLLQTRKDGAEAIREKASRLASSIESYEMVASRYARIKDLPADIEDVRVEIDQLNSEIVDIIKKLGQFENEKKALTAELHNLNVTIAQLHDKLANIEPEQKRLSIAEKVNIVTTELPEILQPVVLDRLQDLITSHFTEIADPRFKGGQVRFPEAGQVSPVFKFRDGKELDIGSMGGFERRTFGIAFSLALAEMTRRRLPLVIDTPLGNADSEYRPRMMEALSNIDLDQIIILTHDQEVNGELLTGIQDKVSQTFLVQYSPELQRSVAFENQFFGDQNGPNI